MVLFVTILHVLLCIALVLIILLQPAKDGSALLGGGVNSMYGPRANAHPLGRATTVIAALFMFTSIFLAFKSTPQRSDDADHDSEIERLEKEKAQRAGAQTTAPEPEQIEEEAPLDGVEAPATDAADQAPATDGAPAQDAGVQDAGVQDAGVQDAPAEGAPKGETP